MAIPYCYVFLLLLWPPGRGGPQASADNLKRDDTSLHPRSSILRVARSSGGKRRNTRGRIAHPYLFVLPKIVLFLETDQQWKDAASLLMSSDIFLSRRRALGGGIQSGSRDHLRRCHLQRCRNPVRPCDNGIDNGDLIPSMQNAHPPRSAQLRTRTRRVHHRAIVGPRPSCSLVSRAASDEAKTPRRPLRDEDVHIPRASGCPRGKKSPLVHRFV